MAGSTGDARDQPFVQRTRQVWKIYLFALLLMASVTPFVLMVVVLNVGTPAPWIPETFTLALATALGGVAAMLWLWLSLRCPSCGASIAGSLVQAELASGWFMKLLTLTRCPKCRFSGEGNHQ
jgi:peptidoglycan/LPS O-acetylase OafA/YrhL